MQTYAAKNVLLTETYTEILSQSAFESLAKGRGCVA